MAPDVPGHRISAYGPWIVTALALLAAAASFILTVEHIHVLADPGYTPTCSVSPVVACGSLMTSSAASLLGFPTSLLGVAGFPALAVLALASGSGLHMPAWIKTAMTAAALAAALAVHALIYLALYQVGTLCLFCAAMWVTTVPAAWTLLLMRLRENAACRAVNGQPPRPAARFLLTYPLMPLLAWYSVLAALVLLRWQEYWLSLIN